MRKIIYLVLAATLVFSGCKKDELSGGIYGVITDKATGEPIRNAGVQLNPLGTKTVTGSEGQYEFTELKAGEYTLQVTKTGYADLVNYSMKVEAGKTTKGDVQIEKLPAALRIVDNQQHNIDLLDFGSAVTDLTRSFNIFNDSPETLEWQITKTAEWITTLSKTDGLLNAGSTQPIIVTIDRNRLAEGANTTTLIITSNNGSKELTVVAIGDVVLDYIVLQSEGIMVQKNDISSGADWNTANTLCQNSTVGGKTGWRLPTREELQALYNNRATIGGFSTAEAASWYWTSTYATYDCHWVLYFYNGTFQSTYNSIGYTSNTHRVRAVRTLP